MVSKIFLKSPYFDSEGLLHRQDGPAVEWLGGTKEWYIHGKLHRDDGPAIIKKDKEEYWFYNVQYSFEEWQQIVKFKAFI